MRDDSLPPKKLRRLPLSPASRAGSIVLHLILGLTPQALRCRALRACSTQNRGFLLALMLASQVTLSSAAICTGASALLVLLFVSGLNAFAQNGADA
jgi:hypothetical protein